MKRILLLVLLLSECERIEDKSNMMISNCHTSTKQQFVEFELLPNDDEKMTREQGLALLSESLSDDGDVWECE